MANRVFRVCGSNDYGQLGLGDNRKRNTFTEVTASGPLQAVVYGMKHMLILLQGGTVHATGNNTRGQLGLDNDSSCTTLALVQGGLTGKTVVKIGCGGSFSGALTADGDLCVHTHPLL